MDLPTVTKRNNKASYSEKELSKLISSSSNELGAILTDMTNLLPGLKEQMKKVEGIIASLPKDLDMGVSLLDLKAQFLLSYDELLLVYILMKLDGADLKEHPLFESLVRSRYGLCVRNDMQNAAGEAGAAQVEDEVVH